MYPTALRFWLRADQEKHGFYRNRAMSLGRLSVNYDPCGRRHDDLVWQKAKASFLTLADIYP